jgi:hypothetical protein
MELISIVVINEGVVESIDTFHINQKEDVTEAEELFKKMVRFESPSMSNEILEICIEDGYYQYGDRSVCLCHSTV